MEQWNLSGTRIVFSALVFATLSACSSSKSGDASGQAGDSNTAGTDSNPAAGGAMTRGDSDAAGSPDTAGQGGASDGGAPDTGDAGDVGLGGCFGALWSGYVQRTDGVLLAEGSAEEAVLDSSTGLPLAGIVSVQDGASHGCAAISDGSVQCWQTNADNGNTSGQLGNGTTTAVATVWRATPVLTAADTPLSNVYSVGYGISNAACAVTNDLNLYCWGDLSWLVKNGTTLHTGYAQQITTDGSTPLTNVEQVALGDGAACALVKGDSSNEVWCWGYDGAGELGQGDQVNRQYPTKVLGLMNPSWIVMAPTEFLANDSTVCAQDSDQVRCWGYNGYGEAGVNSATNPISGPTLVVNQDGTAIDNVVDIEPGSSAFSILRGDGTLWQWGYGFAKYASNFGVTNILGIGYAGGYGSNGPRYVTSDGIYHNGMSNVNVNCGAL